MSLFEQASICVTPNAFKAGKLYSIKGADLDVVRATTATRVNSAGLIESVANNVPRLDYTNGSCPSILVEPQRTNLLTYSEQFDDADWTKENATITINVISSPSGLINADLLTSTSSSFSDILHSTVQVSGNEYTLSCYAKKGSSDWIFLRLTFADAAPRVWFNVNTGAIGTIQSGLTATIESVGNGWYRCSVTGVASATPPADRIDIALANSNGSTSPNIGNSVYIWGTQLEVGSYATSYIPTVATAVTRNADVISKTGISDLIGQSEGTLFMDCKINALPLDGSFFGIQKTSSSFVIRFGSNGTIIYAQSYNGSANLFYETFAYTLGNRIKAAFAYKAGSYAFYINGVQIATGSNATAIPACDETMFNSLWGNFNDSVSFYNNAALWKTRLSNDELQQLTTL
jgi:hypothetical protein